MNTKLLITAAMAALFIAMVTPAAPASSGLAGGSPEIVGQMATTNDQPTGFRVGRKTIGGTIIAPKGGSNFNVSVPEGPPPDYFQDLTGTSFGVFFAYNLGGPAWLQTELFYSRRGSRIEEAGAEYAYKLDYLEAPLLLKLVPLKGAVSPVLAVGPYGSLLLKARGVLTVEGRAESEDIKELFKSMDYGFKLGAGLQFRTGRLLLLVEGRYTHGLANIAKELEVGSVRNRGLALLLGLGF